jgi:hypothetical protein
VALVHANIHTCIRYLRVVRLLYMTPKPTPRLGVGSMPEVETGSGGAGQSVDHEPGRSRE